MQREILIVACLMALMVLLLAGCAQPGGGPSHQTENKASKREDAARIHTELGQKYFEQGRLEIALERLGKALAFDSNYADAHTVLAALYEQIGDVKQAQEHYRRAVQIRPKSGAELNNYGAFLCKLNKLDEAEKYFDRAIADPFYKTPDVAFSNAGSCFLKAGKLDKAEQALRQAVERGSKNADAFYQMASVLYQKGDYFHARAFMQRLESMLPPRPESLLLSRNIELKLGNASGAQDYTRRLRETFPESEQARSLNAPNPL